MKSHDFEGFACIGIEGQLFWLKLEEQEACEQIFGDHYDEAAAKVKAQFKDALKNALVTSALEMTPLGDLIELYLEKLNSDDIDELNSLASLDEEIEASMPALTELAKETQVADHMVQQIIKQANQMGFAVSLVLPDTGSLIQEVKEAHERYREFMSKESLSAKTLAELHL
jgi:DNA-binding MarR family transcriptional regulator